VSQRHYGICSCILQDQFRRGARARMAVLKAPGRKVRKCNTRTAGEIYFYLNISSWDLLKKNVFSLQMITTEKINNNTVFIILLSGWVLKISLKKFASK
jgi:hypothetical protein